MKNKYIIAAFICGMIITILGALLKILHYEFGPITGNVLLTIGMLSQVFSGIVFIAKLFLNKNNEFLNK